jgi:phosphoglycolate phosphatase
VNAETHEQLVQHYSREYLSKQLSRADLFPDIVEMLVELKQAGYQLAVATGKTRHGLQEALRATATEDLFCVTRCADETASKPNPKMLLEIMQVINCPPERALMIGDSIHDLQMANNARISSVGVCCGAHSKDTLQQHEPLLCLPLATELLAYLR